MIDITIARITHVEWVYQLERLLHKETTSASLPSYYDCELGVWLNGEGLRTYKEIPEIGYLVKSHKRFHVAADNVIEWHNGSKFNSQKTAQAEIDFREALAMSKEIVHHLTMLEFKILQKYQEAQETEEAAPDNLENATNQPWHALKSVIGERNSRLSIARFSLDLLKKDIIKSFAKDSSPPET
jgi:hypothetical protein